MPMAAAGYRTPSRSIHSLGVRGMISGIASNFTLGTWYCRLLMGLLHVLLCNALSLGGARAADGGYAAEAALTASEIRYGGAQVVGDEIGPKAIDEAELGVGALPQQEV
jgi:hypothetical protein